MLMGCGFVYMCVCHCAGIPAQGDVHAEAVNQSRTAGCQPLAFAPEGKLMGSVHCCVHFFPKCD